MQPNNQLDYTPMPGEIMKDKSGETGEIQNPYYDEGFENLAKESSEQQIEDQKQEKPIPAESGNALENELNQQWAEGHVDIEAAEQQVQSDFIEGAVEQSTTSENAEADMAAAEKSSTNTPDSEQPKDINQPREISNAASMKAISADVLAEKVKAGDMSKISEVEQRAAEAEALADKISTTAENNATSEQEIQMASSVANQVHEMAQKAIENANEAKAEYDSMNEEEKEETKEAAEAAEANGTDIETEKQKLQKEKEEDKKDNENSPQYRIIS